MIRNNALKIKKEKIQKPVHSLARLGTICAAARLGAGCLRRGRFGHFYAFLRNVAIPADCLAS